MEVMIFSRIPKALDEKLKKQGKKEMASKSFIVRKALFEYLKREVR